MADINHRERTIKVKIVYYGPAVGGKTSNLKVLFERALGSRRGQFLSVNSLQDRTILCDLLPLRSGGFRGYELKLQLAAVPGQAMYAASRRVILKNVDGIVFVANSATDRWHECQQSYQEMIANLLALQLDPRRIPLVLQYNKRDLPEVMDVADLSRAVQVAGLGKTIDDKRVLADITFDVRRGDYVALLGANGAGKTTTLRCVTGLLSPHGGRVRVAADVDEYRGASA